MRARVVLEASYKRSSHYIDVLPTLRDCMARAALCDPTEGTFSGRAITVTAQRGGLSTSTSSRTIVFDRLVFRIALNPVSLPGGGHQRLLASWGWITVALLIMGWV